jgi:glycosyltransferase involved in cell wall biosynthesis
MAAQSVQISSMCQAFYNALGHNNFKLISTKNKENENKKSDYYWDKISLKTNFRYFEFSLKSIKNVLKEKPTHIFTRDIAIAFIFSFFDIKVIYEAHKEPRTKTAHILIERLKNKKNFLLVTISKTLKDYYINNYRFNDNKVFDYHDGVFLDKYDKLRNISKDTLRKELNIPIDKIIIMHTGSLYPGRGAEHFETIIRNFSQVFFVQVGGSDEDIKKYKEYYKEYKNILFIAHQNNDILTKYQMSADLLFYPMTKATSTYWCCSPMKMFEFMATGISILSSNIGSVKEVLNETNSIPFDPDDKTSIIIGVKFFLENKEDCEKKANKALQDINKKYTWEKRANEILEFIK